MIFDFRFKKRAILTKYRPFSQRKSKIINNGVSMSELFQAVIASDEKTDLRQFVSDLRVLGNKYLLIPLIQNHATVAIVDRI